MFASFFAKRNAQKLNDERFRFLFDEAPEDEVVVFDTETTGLNPKKDEILSIGAVKVRGNTILMSEKFELFLKPQCEVGECSIKIHQIRNIDLQNALSPREAIAQFLHFIGARPLVGYYLEFDVAMINKYLKPWLNIHLPNPQIELSGLYHDKKIKRIPDGVIDLRFDVMMKELGLPIFGKHDALNDALMSAMMYVKLQNIGKL
ncbi:3'-5' exonuclease [Sulfurospirillum barnesii]|uniref:DNA polymerase III epsilon subunit-like 3'-5' exonuclease n=1 Tax=Sulfurospirillum barnesii (strain ATCC 700032 / DSM 10660 / SES-3) TaxID=760154 RepID=I3XW57_SULBS|nr:3'-5' exonuclease [Sulfurospirillum barnesii]AFL68181.1 DNA polymerase III epsilon subunit-like 3'-5' exonuclease [Sulfurospirillum barnesii SES-3]